MLNIEEKINTQNSEIIASAKKGEVCPCASATEVFILIWSSLPV